MIKDHLVKIFIFKFLVCIICEERKKESVFVPCGHKSCCLECGEDAFKRFKKCPVCNEEALYLLKRVYE